MRRRVEQTTGKRKMSNDQCPMTNHSMIGHWSLVIGNWAFPPCSSVTPCQRGGLLLAIVSVVALSGAGCSTSAPADPSNPSNPSNPLNPSTTENVSQSRAGALPAVEIELRDGQATRRQQGMRALICSLPDCPGQGEDGQPYLFCRASTHGKWPTAGSSSPVVCPACGRDEGVRNYEPPQVRERRELLEEELRSTRAARRAAKQAGQPMPTDHRTPATLMQDLSNLPKLYPLPK